MDNAGLTNNEPLTAAWYGAAPTHRPAPADPISTSPCLRPTPSPLQPPLPPQTILGSRYRVDQAIGAGAFATVYSAWDVSLNRWVAVKVYDSAAAGPMSSDEVRLQATCQHPNLMPLHDAGSDARLGVTFLVMPLYPGADLSAMVARYGPMPFRSAMVCVEQVCSALEFLWQRRQVPHGDVKPGNIWLTQSGAALLMDFNVQGLLARGACLRAGTPGFTAPEALQGQIDQRSDVFSLGCVLYACLVGTAPFTDDTSVRAGRYVPLRQVRPEVRPELEAIVDTALDPDPERRFQAAREMRSALRSPARMMGIVPGRGGVGMKLLHWSGQALGAGGRAAGALAVATARGAACAVERMIVGAWRVLESVGGSLGHYLNGFFRRLSRRPLQAAVEAVAAWIFGQWAYFAGEAWVHTHLALAAAILATILLGAGTSQGRKRTRRP